MSSTSRSKLVASTLLLALAAWTGPVAAELDVGDQAILFQTVDENMAAANMADMIVDKPLVLVTGSCT